MTEYIIPFIIVLIFGVIGIILVKLSALSYDGNSVEIVIDGNASPENLEMLVRSAKTVAERYLLGARIYIQGGNDREVNLICKCFDIERKE